MSESPFAVFAWACAILCLVGNWLVMRRDRRGFLIWAACNGYWIVYDLRLGAFAQAALMGTYLILAVTGYLTWAAAKTETGEGRP